MRYDYMNSVLNIVSGIAFSGGLISNIYNTTDNVNLLIQRNGVDYITLTKLDIIDLEKQTYIKANGLALTIEDTVDGYFKVGDGESIDCWTGGVGQEMQLNYISKSGVRMGNTGYLAISGLRNGTDILIINGAIQICPADREGGALVGPSKGGVGQKKNSNKTCFVAFFFFRPRAPNLLVLVIFNSF